MDLDYEKKVIIDGKEFYILVETEINNEKYLYVAEIIENDITGNFYVYKEEEQGVLTKITNSEELKEVLPILINLMNN